VQRAAIAYRDGQLEAREQGDVWTVRLANLETRARYLDLALAELLGNAPEAHRAAARLLSELTEVLGRQEAQALQGEPSQGRRNGPATRKWRSTQPLQLTLRVFLLAVVSSAAFMLTTWLATLR
jgi:hypothetical protein